MMPTHKLRGDQDAGRGGATPQGGHNRRVHHGARSLRTPGPNVANTHCHHGDSPGLEQGLGGQHEGHRHLAQLPQGEDQAPPVQLRSEHAAQRVGITTMHIPSGTPTSSLQSF
jgi:hypothetical protein